MEGKEEEKCILSSQKMWGRGRGKRRKGGGEGRGEGGGGVGRGGSRRNSSIW